MPPDLKHEAPLMKSQRGFFATTVKRPQHSLGYAYAPLKRDSSTRELAQSTTGNFQINTDGFPAYKDAVVHSLGAQFVDFAQIVKIYKGNPEKEKVTRYSPSKCIGCEKKAIFGNPNISKASTSHIERQNLTVRMSMRRMTRLTNGFSKKWINLKWSYALQFAYYNFCRVHQTIRVTPAMEAGIADHIWTIEELISINTL